MPYQDYLGQAQSQYSAVIAGYNQALSYQASTAASIQQGYNQLNQDVLGDLNRAGTTRSQEIADRYTGEAGRSMQGLVSRGLGNTTVQNAIGRGLTLDEQKAQNENMERVGGLRAQYRTQIGLSGLGYRGQALRDATGIQMGQLGYMGDYQRMLGQWGMQQESLRASERNQMANNQGFRVSGLSGGSGGFLRPHPGYNQRMQTESYSPDDPYIDLNARSVGYDPTFDYGTPAVRGNDYGTYMGGDYGADAQWGSQPMGIEAWDYYGEY